MLMTQSFVVSSQKMKFLVFLNERQQINIQKCNSLGWFCFLRLILIYPRKQLEHTNDYGPSSAFASEKAIYYDGFCKL